MTLDEVAGALAASGGGAVGTDLFLRRLPDQPDTCAALLEQGALPPQYSFGAVEWERQRLLLLARATSYMDGRQLAERCYRAVLDLRNRALGSTWYVNAEPDHPPYFRGRDDTGRAVFAFSFAVWRRP
jgi:hypothetical protein